MIIVILKKCNFFSYIPWVFFKISGDATEEQTLIAGKRYLSRPNVMESVLNDCLTPTNEMILNLIEIETSLINTNHPDFIGSADSLLNLFQEPDFIAMFR